jgi:alkylhydroperoxidase/carboxymuconolactone decarboxylase family protein YurZ
VSTDSKHFDTTQGWSGDGISRQEWREISDWYRSTHSIDDDLDLVAFAPFMYENRPEALQGYRRWTETVQAGKFLDDPLPSLAVALVHLHYYINIAYSKGILYEIVFARWLGATKQEIEDVLSFAWINAGAAGINAAAEVAADYMRLWTDDVSPRARPWPEDWLPDPAALASGLDFAGPQLTAAEATLLMEWYRKAEGGVPAWVELMTRRYPASLKAFRRRYETAARSLPSQVVPLMELHLALIKGKGEVARRAIHRARRSGVSEDQLVHLGASAQFYLGTVGMDLVAEVLDDLSATCSDEARTQLIDSFLESGQDLRDSVIPEAT